MIPHLQRAVIILALALVLFAREGLCAGIDITNVSVGTLSGGSTTITFDITWSNSWRSTGSGAPAPNNWDAAWVFVKFQKNWGSWAHASLNNTGHSMGSGTAATYTVGYPDTSSAFNIATNPGVGVFIYRSGDGTGTFTATGVQLSWNYSQDGVATNDTIVPRVFGIEMTYINEGAFFAGDSTIAMHSFKQGSSDDDPWYIGSEGSISTANSPGTGTGEGATLAEYYYPGAGVAHGDEPASAFTIPAAFPKGYAPFYMMKGEISQGQWVAFFNTLTATQRTTRDITHETSGKGGDLLVERNNVRWNEVDDATLPDQGSGATYYHVAMNYMSWADLAAYLDWAGLRPMSELEFEKAGRGPYPSAGGEWAWGTATGTVATSISDPGLPTERAQNGSNMIFSTDPALDGPVRVGSFGYGVATRIAAGAGYFGNMELSGNIYERAITVGDSGGRSFEGRYHGDGALSNTGNANASLWPGTSAVGAGLRGGAWNASEQYGKLSCRTHSTEIDTSRSGNLGGRGVRSAP